MNEETIQHYTAVSLWPILASVDYKSWVSVHEAESGEVLRRQWNVRRHYLRAGWRQNEGTSCDAGGEMRSDASHAERWLQRSTCTHGNNLVRPGLFSFAQICHKRVHFLTYNFVSKVLIPINNHFTDLLARRHWIHIPQTSVLSVHRWNPSSVGRQVLEPARTCQPAVSAKIAELDWVPGDWEFNKVVAKWN